MKTVIVSDLHLTDRFDKTKFAYLRNLFGHFDRIIIAGDFWDSYLTGFNKFIQSRWNELFALLKSKQAIYLFGNHDPQELSDERVRLFCAKQQNNYLLETNQYLLSIEHGHRLAPAEDHHAPVFLKNKYIVGPYVFLKEYLPVKFLGKWALGQYRNNNRRMKEFIRLYVPKPLITVCGHTHLPEFNLSERFINLGLNRHHLSWYLSVSEERMELIHEKY